MENLLHTLSIANDGHENGLSKDHQDNLSVDFSVSSRLQDGASLVEMDDERASKERRRERNKLLARKSRLKMKTEMDELKEKFILLMKENESLRKDLVTTAIPGIAAEALIGNNISPPASIMCLVHQLTARTARGWVDPSRLSSVAFCISNALSADIPLVYVSPGFSHLTGYGLHEVLGRNCRFLQGPGTNRDEVQKLRIALQNGQDYTTVLLNYRKDGTPFWNQVTVAHIKDVMSRSFFVVGIQTKVRPISTVPIAAELGNNSLVVHDSPDFPSSSSSP